MKLYQLPLDAIRPAPENDALYRPANPNDPEFKRLVASIREHGVIDPLVVTTDNWILSGHRRHAAAELAGLNAVPCRIVTLNKAKEPGRFLKLLREFNRQRDKSIDEILREEIVSTNPEAAYASMIEHRKEKAHVKLEGIDIRNSKARCEISSAKVRFLMAIMSVLEERSEFLPLSVRQIHYALLNDPPLKHAGKPDSVYRNDRASYQSLDELLTRARLIGRVSMRAISDETRPFVSWDVFNSVADFIRQELDEAFTGYWRNLMRSQLHQIEIVVEKNTVLGVVKPVAMKYCIPITSGRGYCSLPPRYEMAQRFRQSGKDCLIVLLLSDHDPDGEEIAHSFARTMRDDFHIFSMKAIKVALTPEQVQRFGLPPIMTAKTSSTNYQRFSDTHGENVYELEAMQPEDLQRELESAIEKVIDRELFNKEIDREKADAAQLAGVRQRMLRTLKRT